MYGSWGSSMVSQSKFSEDKERSRFFSIDVRERPGPFNVITCDNHPGSVGFCSKQLGVQQLRLDFVHAMNWSRAGDPNKLRHMLLEQFSAFSQISFRDHETAF